MQDGGIDEAKLKSSPCSSPFSSSLTSLSSLSLSSSPSPVLPMTPRATIDLLGERAAGFGGGEWLMGEQHFGAFAGSSCSTDISSSIGNGGQLITLSNVAAAASATSVNITQNVKVGVGDTINVEQVVHVNRRFTVPAPLAFHSQPGHFSQTSALNHGASDLNSLFTVINSSVISQPVNNPYPFPYDQYGNISGFPTAFLPNLKRKLEVFGDPSNSQSLPLYGESTVPQMTCCFCHDSVFQSSSVAAPALQQTLFPVTGRPLSLNYSADELMKPEVSANEDMSISSASQELRISGTSLTACPIHKRVVRQKQISKLSWCLAPDGSNNICFSTRSPSPCPQLRDHNGLDPVPNLKQPLVPSLLHLPEHLNATNLSEHDKEVDNGWMMILQKELRNSDVGSLGRIVLPKRDCEANLPPLLERSGMILVMEDLLPPLVWEFKYRYWPNNKSRMYVMESTGDFVKMHELQAGDFFIIYKEQGSGKYFVRGKKACRRLQCIDQAEMNRREQGNSEKGSSSKQQLKNNRGKSVICPQCKEYEGASFVTPKAEPEASPTNTAFGNERDASRPSEFHRSSPPDFDPEMLSFDRYLP